MRNLFALVGVLVVGAGGAGWYLGWYKVSLTKNPDGNLQIQTDVDTKKVSGDSTAFFQKVGQMVSEKVQQTGQNGAMPPANTPALPPGTTSTVPGINPAAGPIIPPQAPGSGFWQPTNPAPAAPPPPPAPPGLNIPQ
jgi:hypothetical protein